jgi:hypothetical protein
MNADFNLSEKLRHSHNEQDLVTRHIHIEEIKEFIKRLKEELCNEYLNTNNGSSCDRIPQQSIIEKIDNLAGDDLK